MVKGLKMVAAAALTASIGLAGQAAFANCAGEGPYELRQCGRSWFAPPPAGAGTVSTQWWDIGFGNALLFQSATAVSPEGSGFLPTPLPGVFIGNDSGSLNTQELGLIDATTFGGPVGSLCFGPIANWGSPGIDGCGDNNRNATAGGGALNVSNQYVNPYWDPAYGPGLKYYTAQVDAPMGVLLKESNNVHFALAFFASRSRGGDENDFAPGEFDVAALVNGDSSPTGPNVVPWQLIPQPLISAVLAVPADPNSARNLTVSWTAIRNVNDNSNRPCFDLDGTTTCPSMAPGVTGVGINNHPALIHYDLESTTLDPGTSTCGTAWTRIGGVDHPGTSTNGTVPANSCVRLTTRVGKTPGQAPNPTATTTVRDQNRLAAQTGRFGDIGYGVSSSATKVGGPTVSANAVLKVASKNKNMVLVQWDTTAEVGVTGFDVVGIDAKGTKKVVASTVACKQCNSGLGASYSELIQSNKFQGSKKVQIVSQPSGNTSNTLDLN